VHEVKIEDNNNIQRLRQAYNLKTPSVSDSLAAKDAQGKDAQTQSNTIKRDEVSISPLVKELQKTRQAITANPTLREEKIAELRQLIANGQYGVSNEQLAEKIISHFLDQ
jgi:flagellar biosynthesis anti-sigma factor FlgM